MKNKNPSHILFGAATGLTIWFLNELWIYLYSAEFTSSRIEMAISGTLIGIGFGTITLIKSGFFADNLYKVKRGDRKSVV